MGTLELVGVTPKYLTTINRSSFETFGLGSQVPVRKVIRYIFPILYFVHPIFCYRFLVTFGDQVTKIQKYYVIFLYILQVKMDKTEKNGMKVMQLK